MKTCDATELESTVNEAIKMYTVICYESICKQKVAMK